MRFVQNQKNCMHRVLSDIKNSFLGGRTFINPHSNKKLAPLTMKHKSLMVEWARLPLQP